MWPVRKMTFQEWTRFVLDPEKRDYAVMLQRMHMRSWKRTFIATWSSR